MKKYIIEAVALLATAKAGQDQMSANFKQRAVDKWEHSKQLPRKAKKLMRKDAQLDYAFGCDAGMYDFMDFI